MMQRIRNVLSKSSGFNNLVLLYFPESANLFPLKPLTCWPFIPLQLLLAQLLNDLSPFNINKTPNSSGLLKLFSTEINTRLVEGFSTSFVVNQSVSFYVSQLTPKALSSGRHPKTNSSSLRLFFDCHQALILILLYCYWWILSG